MRKVIFIFLLAILAFPTLSHASAKLSITDSIPVKEASQHVNRPGQDHFYDEIIYMKLDYCAISSTNMVWKLNGENLILNFGKQAFIYRILKLNETNFDVAIKIDFNGDGKEDDVEIYAVRGDCTHDSYCQ